jgi:hypothetical protein
LPHLRAPRRVVFVQLSQLFQRAITRLNDLVAPTPVSFGLVDTSLVIRRVSGVEDRVGDGHAFESRFNSPLSDIDAVLRE